MKLGKAVTRTPNTINPNALAPRRCLRGLLRWEMVAQCEGKLLSRRPPFCAFCEGGYRLFWIFFRFWGLGENIHFAFFLISTFGFCFCFFGFEVLQRKFISLCFFFLISTFLDFVFVFFWFWVLGERIHFALSLFFSCFYWFVF